MPSPSPARNSWPSQRFRYTPGMRIDPLLCQKILIAIEGDPNAGSGQFIRVAVEGYDQQTIAEHVKYLWDEKLIRGKDVTNFQSTYPEIMIQGITPAGRRYLDEREPNQTPPKKFGL